MAGILDSKERMMDYIITQEGKRQAGFGELRVKFASFTDCHTFYETSGSQALPDLAANASDRILFEAYSRYQDVVVPELEAGMSMRPFRTADFQVAGNMIASGTFKVGFLTRADVMLASASAGAVGNETGYAFPAQAPALLAGVTQNFADQRIIASIDEYSLQQDFGLSPSTHTFGIDDKTVYLRASKGEGRCDIDDVPSLFHDWRFSRFQNFRYLPPKNLPLPGFTEGDALGRYPHLNEEVPSATFDDVFKNVLDGKDVVDIKFDPTSRANNIVCQVFESSPQGFEKLAIVDFGTFDDEKPGTPASLQSPGRHVLFAGKMKKDSTGAETFMCIFTIVID